MDAQKGAKTRSDDTLVYVARGKAMSGKAIIIGVGTLIGAGLGFRYQERWVDEQRDIATAAEVAAHRAAVQRELELRQRTFLAPCYHERC